MSGLNNASVSFILNGVTYRNSDLKRYVARCPKLHLSASGTTAEEAETRWRGILSVYLESCRRRGTLLRVLKEADVPFELFDAAGNKISIDEGGRDQGIDLASIMPMIKWGQQAYAGNAETVGNR